MFTMKFARDLFVLLVLALLLTACGKDDAADKAAGTVDGAASNSLLALVPNDTPYLGGNLAPVPDEVIDSYLKRAEPVLAAMQERMAEIRQEIASHPEELESDSGARLAHALLEELDGKLNRPGLESLGIDLSPEQVVYGMSAFPVMRTSLSNAEALRATVQRVLDKAGVDAPVSELGGQQYWRFIPEDHMDDLVDVADSTDPGAPRVGIYIAILPDHMAIGVLPVAAEASVLPAFLAQEIPASSNAAERLEEINQRFDYSPHGSGVIEFQRMLDELTSPDTLAGQFIQAGGHDLAAINSDVCRQEISGIIARTPRAYSGFREFSETTVSSRMVLETESLLAGELLNLVADVPPADPDTGFLAELALGLKVGPVRDFLRMKAAAIAEVPYQCEALADLNQHARDAADQLNQPIPPMVNNLFGLRAAISSMGGLDAPQSAQGLLSLHVTQPEMLVGMAQMLVPGLAELDLSPGAEPVQVPADMLPIPGMVIYAAQAKTTLGLSVGEGQQAGLVDFINQEGKSDGTFLSVNYDAAAYMDLTGNMGMNNLDQGDTPPQDDLGELISEEYRKLVDRSDMRFSFSRDGFVVDNTTTLKNP
jgi:hypothetical protein